MRPISAVALLAALLTLPLAAASGETDSAVPVIRIGALLPLTGDLESSGRDDRAALELAAADISEYLAARGTPVRLALAIEDTATNPDTALQKAEALVEQGIRIAIGPESSAEVWAVKDFADDNDLLILSHGSTAPSLALPGDNVFRMIPDDSRQAEAIAALMRRDGIRTVVMLTRRDVYGDELSAAVRNYLRRDGCAAAGEVKYEPDAGDFSGAVTELNGLVEAALKAGDDRSIAVYFIGFSEVVPIFRQAAAAPALARVRWYGSDGTTRNAELTADHEAAAFAARTGFPCPIFMPDSPDAAHDTVLETTRLQIRRRIGHEPEPYAFAAWDALWVAALAHTAAGPGADFEALRSALRDTFHRYSGVLGPGALNEADDRDAGSYGFFSVAADEDGFAWKRTATFHMKPPGAPSLSVP